MMASAAHQEKGRDVVLPTIDVFIQALHIARDACGIPPAQIALGSACALLIMIRVDFPLCEDGLVTDIYLGHYGQLSGLRRTREELRQCVSSAPSEIDW